MAQQAVRRVRRTAGREQALWRGLLISIGATIGAVILFALIIALTNPEDGIIRIVNQFIKLAAIFVGVRAIVPKGAENGVRRGALLGLIYMGVGVLLYALLSQQKLTVMGYAIDVLMGVAVGGLSGMLMSGMKG